MTKEEILELIRNKESSKVEFKEDNIGPRDIAREMVAFANLDGGIILIGVSDEGKILGTNKKDIEEWVMNIGRGNCYPSLIPIFERVTIDDKTVGVITIPKRQGTVHRTSDGHYYIRVGSTVRDATLEELSRLFQSAGMVHYDISPVYSTSISDLDQDRLKYYLSNILKININEVKEQMEQLLANIEVMIKVDEGYCLTLAGLLVFGKDPERFLPQAGIIVAKFPKEDMDYEMIKMEIKGPLVDKYDEQGMVIEDGVIGQAIRFVQSNTILSSKIEGGKRIDIMQYPQEAIREGIVNALSHRDYTISYSRIRLFIFQNRIEIHSPGRLPNTVTLEGIKRTAHYTRNPILFKLFEQYKYVEGVGLGIPHKIIRKMIEHNGKEPKLEESGEEFILTLFG